MMQFYRSQDPWDLFQTFASEPFSGLPLDQSNTFAQGLREFSGFPFPFGQPHGRPRHRGHSFASCGSRRGFGPRGHGACHPRSHPHLSGSERDQSTAETLRKQEHSVSDTHPLAQILQSIAEVFAPDAAADAGPSSATAADANANANASDPAALHPPLDLFATPSAYIIHLALPGAQKEDITVDWDADGSALRIAGVVHRPGDEALLSTLVPGTAERPVGYFERVVPLPPSGAEPVQQPQPSKQAQKQPEQPQQAEQAEQKPRRPLSAYVETVEDSDDEVVHTPDTSTLTDGDVSDTSEVPIHVADVEAETRDEIDEDGITARMQDGLLIITVPRVERGWTDVHKVDIE
ncbi:hypothetical protein ACRALDRAFT_1070593 [Sodiomyces alcalophilus JCM 7366]|uniref:uncharacterized protein n=1 Tax=Sodiomyces alcalophilus JCM 7366 TaxID=591952 RepID=UPI0039B4EB96